MEALGVLLVWSLFGLVCGALARLLIPGRQPMGILMTMLLGVIGSFVGGFLAYIVAGGEALQASGFFLSILGAVLTLAVYVSFVRNRREQSQS